MGTSSHPYTAAILAAGGFSTRMGQDKLAFSLGGEPVLVRSAAALEQCSRIDEIIVVVQSGAVDAARDMLFTRGFQKIKAVVPGGNTRFASVQNGASAVSAQTELLCIHDAARPFVTDSVICRVLKEAEKIGAATAAVPVKNTIKVSDSDGMVLTTPDRSTLWEIQTPQCFRRILYQKAAEHGNAQDATDDCMLLERIGFPVQLVMGDYRNIKLTTPEDLLIARTFWEEQA